ncbi:chloroplastic import inner membrane translocase subunit HP30-2-like [Bidens hawaiensis]|uniref:chloroplastic import inner membrane translocase subunit HP30-2-like n=1 Tax=Bidens hawaiensis TaxID=980011 RepID=UPI00404B8EDA
MTFAKKQVTELVTKYKEMEYNFKNWLHKQPLAVKAAITAIINGAPCFAGLFVVDTILYNPACNNWLPFTVPPIYHKTTQANLIDARNFGVLVGYDNGIQCVMRKTRGKDDIQTSMASGFGVGVLLARNASS